MIDYLHTKTEDLEKYDWDEYFKSPLFDRLSLSQISKVEKTSRMNYDSYLITLDGGYNIDIKMAYDDTFGIKNIDGETCMLWLQFDVDINKLSTSIFYEVLKYCIVDSIVLTLNTKEVSTLCIAVDNRNSRLIGMLNAIMDRQGKILFPNYKGISNHNPSIGDNITLLIATK